MRFPAYLILCLVCLAATISCKTEQKIVYLQDLKTDTATTITAAQSITVQPKDMLSIVVSSKNPELAAMFNLPIVSYQAGSEMARTGYQELTGYVVDEQGNINFPILGSLHVAGLTRWQLQNKIKDELTKRDLLKDMVVTVEFLNFKISILGEVSNPGTYNIKGDKATLLEAISMAHDLTIYGRRDQVYVIREQNNTRTTYRVDLRSSDLFNSPAYYLKQNDIIYVQPNKVRSGQSTINDNSMKSASFWISIASLLSSLGVLIVNIVDK